jgi:Rod binding domain-containing protein
VSNLLISNQLNPLNQGATTVAVARAGVAASQPAAASPKLVHAAHEFEAAMMKELLAPLETGKDGLTGGDDDDSGSSSALGSFASEALGKAISEHGGFGIATGVLKQLAGTMSRASTVTHSWKATAPIAASRITMNSRFK